MDGWFILHFFALQHTQSAYITLQSSKSAPSGTEHSMCTLPKDTTTERDFNRKPCININPKRHDTSPKRGAPSARVIPSFPSNATRWCCVSTKRTFHSLQFVWMSELPGQPMSRSNATPLVKSFVCPEQSAWFGSCLSHPTPLPLFK